MIDKETEYSIMDISSLIGTMMSADSVQNIGKAAEADPKAVKNVLSAALPSLINGAKAQSEDTSTGFAEALLSHGKDDTSDLASFLGKVDLKDGGKIIGHLLGSASSDEIAEISRKAGASKKDTSNILSAAAPLLMSLLGKQASSSSSDSSASAVGSVASLLLKNVDVGSLLGNLLGGKDDKDDKDEKEDKKDKKEGNHHDEQPF